MIDPVLMEQFAKLREQGMMKIKEEKEQGKKVVGMYCTYSPQELIMAADAYPVSLCGTKQEPIAAAEKVLPHNLCPLIKSSYGFAATDTCPFFNFADLLVAETTCDGKKKMYELLAQYKPMHLLQLPQEQAAPESKDLWLQEVQKLKVRLEQHFGVELTPSKLRAAIKLANRERKALRDLYELNRHVPAPLTGLEILTVAHNRGFYPDKEKVITMLEELTASVKAGLGKNEQKEGPRILLTGVPVGLGSEKVIKLVEELGGTVVCQENCTGYKPVDVLVDEDENKDPLQAIAEKYLAIACSCMSPNAGRYELLGRLAKEFKVDGVLDLTWIGCHTYNVEAYSIKKYLDEQFGLPYIQVETDYSSSDTEQLRVRIEAFIEMLQA
ncbi:double-cubane-cluster-containing anaerobic reductase [Anaerospora sp.]|jgi:benzoyl-CoA reductase/2-hydroxyglutaryl-CoA dehydratase subunit BcrC/BadD/HgdB|uniref:double-cubane-cluster-containing anaerobic reductase n=1 Tax=Anaerospora sp. TaxID=1960278 RepID=UPI00289F99D4|nr:double-cubane-cluster-containing anaerobic reductase [Anaerospora sp.]